MELDATFKPSGRPRNPNKERQLKERLYFNCNNPGHMARDCKQPKKGNSGRKFGRQLNATWQERGGYNSQAGQPNATSKGKEVWEVTAQDLEEFDTWDGEDDEEEGKELQLRSAAEIDHPWHNFVPWLGCYTHECLQHYKEKTEHSHFPIGQRPVYYD